MATVAETLPDSADPDDMGPVLPRRQRPAAEDVDMTPMIDVTFLLLIFFMVTGLNEQTGIELPPAKFGKGVSEQQATIITLADRQAPGMAWVYLADNVSVEPLPDDPAEQETLIREFVEAGRADNNTAVLIKAGRTVHHRDVARVARAAGQVPGMTLHVAVLEVE